jgi:hypothetical protein
MKTRVYSTSSIIFLGRASRWEFGCEPPRDRIAPRGSDRNQEILFARFVSNISIYDAFSVKNRRIFHILAETEGTVVAGAILSRPVRECDLHEDDSIGKVVMSLA